MKAEEIACINIKDKVSYTDYIIIATCRSTKHTNAVAEELIINLKKKNIHCPQPEGRPRCDWIIVDIGDVIVHLFIKEVRLRYDLEKFWDIKVDLLNNNLA